MDIVESCNSIIEQHLEELNQGADDDYRDDYQATQQPTQAVAEAFVVDRDKNINKILNQQAHLKRIIDEDNHIQLLKSSILRVSNEIDGLRKQCTKLNADAIKNRQELAEIQAKELERYQMGQLRSIAEDYSRHQDILEQRKKEIQSLKKEIEREENERDVYLTDVEKKLDKQLQDRQKSLRNGNLPFQLNLDGSRAGQSNASMVFDQDNLELTSVDEYAPYGTAPHSRVARGASSRGRGRGGGKRKRS